MKPSTYKESYQSITSACLNITNECSCACKYCFVNQNPKKMSLQIAKDSITFLHNNKKNKDKIIVNFFGGEPILYFKPIIKPLVLWVEKTYPNEFNFGVTTNGCNLSQNIIEFLKDHNIIPLLSFDGTRETQEYNRPLKSGGSSFDAAMENIPSLLENFPNMVCRMTIYEDTCTNFFQDIAFIERLGFKYFFATPDSRHNFSEANEEKLGIELSKFFTYFSCCIANGIMPIQSSMIKNSFILALKEPSLKKEDLDKIMPREIFRCGLGTTSVGIGPDGKIYGCQEQVTNDDNIFYLGDIYKGIDPERHMALLGEFRQLKKVTCEDPERCKGCAYKPFCYDIECPSMAKERFNDFFISSKTLCFWRSKLIELAKACIAKQEPNMAKYLLEVIEEEKAYELYYPGNNLH